MAGQKESNWELRRSCCRDCRCDGDFCIYRKELPNDVGTTLEKDGHIYTKGCKYFEWD